MKSSSSLSGLKFSCFAQQAAQDVGQLVDHRARLLRVGAYQRGERVQGVEQEMRMNLPAQRIHAALAIAGGAAPSSLVSLRGVVPRS